MQGFNMGRYVPPEHEGVLKANQASGKGHALGRRASKPGALTVRFEMPFAVWCDHCTPQPTLIGQGVRFNAEKRRAGSYYSSTIWAFRIKHVACGGVIEIRTDPRNTAYVVAEGGRRRDTGEAKKQDDSLVPTGDALLAGTRMGGDADAERQTAFATLEKTIKDRAALAAAAARIDALEEAAEKQWEDPYVRNQALRRTFRAGRQEREAAAGRDEEVRARFGGLGGVALLPASEEDARWARLVEFGPPRGQGEEERVVLARPLFEARGSVAGRLEETRRTATATATATAKKKEGKGGAARKLKSEVAASKHKESLASEIAGNMRMGRDPFLKGRRPREVTARSTAAAVLAGLKRKRDALKERSPAAPREDSPAEKVAGGLVDYDSD